MGKKSRDLPEILSDLYDEIFGDIGNKKEKNKSKEQKKEMKKKRKAHKIATIYNTFTMGDNSVKMGQLFISEGCSGYYDIKKHYGKIGYWVNGLALRYGYMEYAEGWTYCETRNKAKRVIARNRRELNAHK